MTDTYAIVDGYEITHTSGQLTDERAQAWYRRCATEPTERLVVLDLGDGEEPMCGRRVAIDEDGIATLSA